LLARTIHGRRGGKELEICLRIKRRKMPVAVAKKKEEKRSIWKECHMTEEFKD